MSGEGGGSGKGRGRDGGYLVLKLSVCQVPVLHHTCDFSLLSYNVMLCYAIYVIALV